MSIRGDLAAGLAFLLTILNDNNDQILDKVLAEWCEASGWRTAGLAWPFQPTTVIEVRGNAVEHPALAPLELPVVVENLRGGDATTFWQTPQSAGKLYTLLQPPGRSPGIIWAEQTGEHWTEEERNYFKLSSRIIERSPILARSIGGSIDLQRLNQRLTDVATIAGRMAHDFDNILTGIIGFADLTLQILPEASQSRQFVSEIAKVGQRGTVFTNQLHQFSRSGQTRPQPSSVAAVVAREDVRLRSLMPAGMKFRIDVPAGLQAVAMEASTLQTVLGHVLDNAIESCDATRTVAVRARTVDLDAAAAELYLGRVGIGAHVEVQIQDDGSGIKPATRAKLFLEPFFTTKVRHRGLGLATVLRILSAHRGGVRLDAATPPEVGVLVRVVIPLASARPTVVTATPGGSTLSGVS